MQESKSNDSQKNKTDDDNPSSVYSELYHLSKTRDEWEPKPNPTRRIIMNTFYFMVGIVLPIAGFMIWVVFKDDRPEDAIYPGIGTLIGTIMLVSFNVLRLVVRWY